MEPRDDKLKELVLYIADKSADDPRFGKVKLNRLLFYADFIMFDRDRRPITGQEYMKLPKGPAPKRMLPVLRAMQSAGELRILKRKYFDKSQQRPIALRAADLSVFSAEEISVVDEVLPELWNVNATETSELSHRFIGWRLARERETIPYSTVYLSTRELTPEEIDHGIELQDS
jgi:hypothetical protein